MIPIANANQCLECGIRLLPKIYFFPSICLRMEAFPVRSQTCSTPLLSNIGRKERTEASKQERRRREANKKERRKKEGRKKEGKKQ